MSPPRFGMAKDVAAVLGKELGAPTGQKRTYGEAAHGKKRDEEQLFMLQIGMAKVAAQHVLRLDEQILPIGIVKLLWHLVHESRRHVDSDGGSNSIPEVYDPVYKLWIAVIDDEVRRVKIVVQYLSPATIESEV